MSTSLTRNALANALQTLASAGLLFALYRFINSTLGVEQLGVWSVVLATVSASRLADFGLSAGVIRFVARDRARGELDRAGQVIDSAALALMASVGVVLPLLYPLIAKLLPHLFEKIYLVQALSVLPYALMSLWLTIVAAVFQGGLDGCQRMGLRAGLVVTGQIVMLVLAIWLVPRRGIAGLALAQIGQGAVLAVGGRLLLISTLPGLPWLPRRWNKSVFREMLGYGINVQTASVFLFLLGPIAKALMARFGGPAAAGYFEMANQVVLKARSVIVTANKAVVPHLAALAETKPAYVTNFYHENMRVLVFFTLPVLSLLFAWTGGVSWLLVGTYQPEFVFLLQLLIMAWGANIFAGPAYFTHMGTGQVGWNTFSHLIMAVLNIGLGLVFGSRFGAHGVAFAYSFALVIGSWSLIAAFQRKNAFGWRGGISREHHGLILVCIAVVVTGFLIPLRPLTSSMMLLIALVMVPPLVLGAAVWFHPMRPGLLGELKVWEV